jgi:[ribosomal protein S5]-alanine N-acetyltransferase
MNFNVIPTKRLLLREMTPQVYQHVFVNYTDEELKLFFGLQTDEALEQKKGMYNNGMTTFNKSFLYFQLLKKDSKENIGWCGYHTYYTQHSRAELGYVLTAENERAKGYMKEALPEIIKYGFDTVKLHRIEAFVGPTNTPSLKLIEQLGFRKEGHLKEHYFKNGIAEDSILFGLLRSEYESRL